MKCIVCHSYIEYSIQVISFGGSCNSTIRLEGLKATSRRQLVTSKDTQIKCHPKRGLTICDGCMSWETIRRHDVGCCLVQHKIKCLWKKIVISCIHIGQYHVQSNVIPTLLGIVYNLDMEHDIY